jgi:hypothetical protein
MGIGKKLALILSISVYALSVCYAQKKAKVASEKTNSIEIDPATFFYNGYSLHLRVRPANVRHFAFGLGIYSFDIPKEYVDRDSENANKGWHARLSIAGSMFGEYYFKEATEKWFVGLQAGVQNFKNTNDSFDDEFSSYTNAIAMPYLGYSWYPFKFPFYVKPMIGVGYSTLLDGTSILISSGTQTVKSTKEYHLDPITPFASIHIGYTFK